MPQTLMGRVVECFREVVPQDGNQDLVRIVAERLRAQGMKVITRYATPVCFGRRHTTWFIDMAIIDDGITLGIEVDHLTPRKRSILKLRAARLDCRLIVLTHPEAQAKLRPVGGIDAVVAVPHRPQFRTHTPARASDTSTNTVPLAPELRRAIETYVECRDPDRAALLAGMDPKEFRRLMEQEDIKGMVEEKIGRVDALVEKAQAELQAYGEIHNKGRRRPR